MTVVNVMTEEQREAKKQYLRERRRKIKERGMVEIRGIVKVEHKAKCEAYLERHGGGK